MLEDIVICETYHSDPLNHEYCNPLQITVGHVLNDSLLISLVFGNPNPAKAATLVEEDPLQISVEVLGSGALETRAKYDMQEGCEITISDSIEIYKFVIGSTDIHHPHFTNLPAINNTTSFGDTIYLTFVHPVEGFMFQHGRYRTFT